MPVVENVQDFTLDYQTITYQKRSPPVENAEIQLAFHNGGLIEYRVTLNDHTGQFFMPSNLDPEALSWKVTRVLVELKRHGGTGGETLLQIRTPTLGNLPGPTIYEQMIVSEADLPAASGNVSVKGGRSSVRPCGRSTM